MLLAEVEAKLISAAPMNVAWGGYLAQRYRIKGATTGLCKALGRWRDVDGIVARVVRLHLVDGLLGNGSKVPADQVAPLLKDALTRDAAFAIIAQNPRVNRETILQLALAPAKPGDVARIAAGRLLISSKLPTSELGDYTLRRFHCNITITMDDPNTAGRVLHVVDVFGDDRTPKKELRRRTGFPPLPRIELHRSGSNKHTVRMIVPDDFKDPSIVLIRKENTSYNLADLEFGELEQHIPQPELMRLVQGMSRVRNFKQSLGQNLDWKDDDSFLKQVVEPRNEVAAKLDKVVDAMRRDGWLSSNMKRDFRIALKVNIHDYRGNQTKPPPDLPAVPARIPAKR